MSDNLCGMPALLGPCQKPYLHVSPGHWAEPVWENHDHTDRPTDQNHADGSTK